MLLIIISIGILGSSFSETKDQIPLKYNGLTQGQITEIKLMEEQCKQNSLTANLGGDTAQKIYAKKCQQTVEDKINKYKTSNTISLAISTQDVSLCEELQDDLICIKEYALALNMPQLCNGAGYVEPSCIQEIAKKYKQIETCSFASDNSQCFSYFAQLNNDPSTCEKANNSTDCFYRFAFELKTPDICQKATNPTICLDTLANSADPSICRILDKNRLETCYKKYATININNVLEPKDWSGYTEYGKNAMECKNSDIYNEFDVYACRIQSLVTNDIPKEILFSGKTEGYGGLNICKIIGIPKGPNNTSTDQCLAALAVFYNDRDMCEQIHNTDYDFRGTCLKAINP